MTDNEIIKALEHCSADDSWCDDCPYENLCTDTDITKFALDLINRQKAETEERDEIINAQSDKIKLLEQVLIDKTAEIERLNKALTDSIKHLEEGIALAKQTPDIVISAVTEVIEGLLDKIEKQAIPNEDDVYWVELDDIYNLVKEMVGEG